MKPRVLFSLLLALWGPAAISAAAESVAAAPAPQRQAENLTLAQALAMANNGSHDLRLAQAMLESARAAITVADNGPNPMLTLQTININPAQGVGSGGLRSKTVDSTLRVDQLIERGDKRALRTKNAVQLEQAAAADLADSARQMRLTVTQAYYDLLAAQDKVRLNDDTTSLFDKTRAAALRRKDAGDIAGADVARIEVDLYRARNDSSSARADLRRAQLALALLLGRPAAGATANDAVALRASDAWPAPDTQGALAISDTTLAQAIAGRADVRAARARLEAAETGLRQALALRKRDVSVGVQAEHWPQNGGNSYGLAVQIPLFVRNEYNGEIRAAMVAVDSAHTTLEKTSATAQNEAWRAREDLRSAAERLQRFQEELLGASGKSAEAAEFAFRKGAIGVMDVLDARRVQRATELDAIAARNEHARALAAWNTVISTESLQ